MESWTLKWSKLTQFTEKNLNEISESGGVYRLSYKADNEEIYVFYVGQAANLKTRLQQHSSINEENICVKNYLQSRICYFRYAIITREYLRSATERIMFNKYNPRCNENKPDGREDIEINLN